MFIGIIYKYVSPSNKIYIGQTTREYIRRREFLNKNKEYAGQAINNARKKYKPEQFKYSILLKIQTFTKEELRNELNFYESYFIKVYKSNIVGYNLNNGGETNLGYIHTEATKIAISNSMIGHRLSPETKNKISNANKGKHGGKRPKSWYENRKNINPAKWRNKPVASYTSDMTLVNTYISIKEASKIVGINESAIRKALKRNSPCAGFIWREYVV